MIQNRIKDWTAEIEAISSDYINTLQGLDIATLNTKPNANTWSIAQVLEHIIKTNESYYSELEDIKSGKIKISFWGKIGFLNNFFGNFILKSVQPDAKRKIKTFPVWEPANSNISGDILLHFQQDQDELVQFIQDNADLIEKDQRIYSPASKAIVYKFDKVVEILIAHERRHLK